jgi:hypothetical protein
MERMEFPLARPRESLKDFLKDFFDAFGSREEGAAAEDVAGCWVAGVVTSGLP